MEILLGDGCRMMTVRSRATLFEDTFKLVRKLLVTNPPFSFHDLVGKPVQIILGTVGD